MVKAWEGGEGRMWGRDQGDCGGELVSLSPDGLLMQTSFCFFFAHEVSVLGPSPARWSCFFIDSGPARLANTVR
jgi:hypothetical protein